MKFRTIYHIVKIASIACVCIGTIVMVIHSPKLALAIITFSSGMSIYLCLPTKPPEDEE